MELDGTPDRKVKSAYEVALDRTRTGNVLGMGDRDQRRAEDPDDPYAGYDFVEVDNVTKRVEAGEEVEHSPGHAGEENVEDIEELTVMPKLPKPDHVDFDVCCHWTGPLFDYGGYAKMNRSYIIGLKKLGALVKVQPIESITNVNNKTEEFIRYLANIELPKKYPKVYGMTIPDIISHGGPKILYTMMETSNHVHSEYAERLNLADEIWTPCQWNVDVFRASNVYSKIVRMPLGVDTNLYRPGAEPLQFSNGTKDFKFLSVFGWSYRKGMDVLLQAYLQEFGPDDDVSLILSTRFVGTLEQSSHDRILNDFNHIKSLIQKTDAEMPHVVLHSAYTPEHRMPRLYASAHCFVLPSRGEGFGLPYCSLPGTQVETADGQYMNIEHVEPQQELTSLSGFPACVLAAMSREYDGEICEVNAVGLPGTICTPEHPFMSVKRRSRYDVGKDLGSRIEEIEASSLENGDFLVYPITEGQIEEYSTVDLRPFGVGPSKYSNLGVLASWSWGSLAERIGEHKNMVARAILGNDHISEENRRRILRKLDDIGFEYRKEKYDAPQELKLDEKLMRFFGLYIAEGSSSRADSIGISSHTKESDIQDFERTVVKRYFGRNVHTNTRGNKTELIFHLCGGRTFFSEFGTDARNKHIPSWLMQYRASLLLPLVRGIFEGDGCVAKHFINISSSSRRLLLQVRRILLGVGVRSSISKSRTRDEEYALVVAEDADKMLELIGHEPVFGDRGLRRTHQWISNGFLYSIVRSVDRSDYCGLVYNLDTDGDSTYIGDGFAMHNCEAGACGLPVIASDHGGQKDFLDEEVAYMVPHFGYYTSRRIDPPFRNMAWISHFYEDQEFPQFTNESVEILQAQMRHVYENYSEAQEKAKKLRARIIERYDWSVCVQRVYQRLSEICGGLK